MGRETKILLALLATLVGVFVGVLSMKLLVPRPPAGAGPDVHIDVASTEAHELVDPPTLSPPAPRPANIAADTDMASFSDTSPPPPSRYAETAIVTESGDLLPPPMATEPAVGQSLRSAPSTTTVEAHEPVSAAAVPAAPPRRDPFVSSAGFQMPITQPADREAAPPAGPMPMAAAAYVTNPGDSWWDLAERSYGDGRLYRALFAWNRVIDPRVSLAPGTRLEIPPRVKLEAAWPKLMPAQ
jgi:hypothetical protein